MVNRKSNKPGHKTGKTKNAKGHLYKALAAIEVIVNEAEWMEKGNIKSLAEKARKEVYKYGKYIEDCNQEL